MFDIKQAKEEANKEFAEDRVKEAKGRIKSKLKEIDKSKKIVRNLERELEDLYSELTE